MLPPPPSEFTWTPTPSKFRRGAGRQAASQEEDRGVVAEERPQGTASSPRSLFARRQRSVPVVRDAAVSGARGTGPVRREMPNRKPKFWSVVVKRRGRPLHMEKSLD